MRWRRAGAFRRSRLQAWLRSYDVTLSIPQVRLKAFTRDTVLDNEVVGSVKDDVGLYRDMVPATSSRLAKGAVEDDLGQGALENGELLVVQLSDEFIGNSAHVDRSCDGQTLQSGVCQLDHDTARVGIGVGTTNQAFVNEPGDAPGHAGACDEGSVRQLC